MHEQALAAAAALLNPQGVDVERRDRGGAPLQRRRSLVGARHRRHPLRALSGRRRAADDRGEARRRRDAERPHGREPDGQPSRAVGRAGRRSGPAPVRRVAGPRLRRDQLEHVPGQPVDDGRRRGHLQVRLDGCRRGSGSRGRRRAQPPRRRARQAARRFRAQRLARRRYEPSRPGELPAAVRPRCRLPAPDPRCAPRGLDALHRAQAVRALVLLDRGLGLGFVVASGAGGGTARRDASSTSDTISRTRTSSRSSRASR